MQPRVMMSGRGQRVSWGSEIEDSDVRWSRDQVVSSPVVSSPEGVYGILGKAQSDI